MVSLVHHEGHAVPDGARIQKLPYISDSMLTAYGVCVCGGGVIQPVPIAKCVFSLFSGKPLLDREAPVAIGMRNGGDPALSCLNLPISHTHLVTVRLYCHDI